MLLLILLALPKIGFEFVFHNVDRDKLRHFRQVKWLHFRLETRSYLNAAASNLQKDMEKAVKVAFSHSQNEHFWCPKLKSETCSDISSVTW